MINLDIFKLAGIEVPSGGGKIGVSTSTRKYWRKNYESVPGMQGTNDEINFLIAIDYSNATPLHRIILKSGEPGELRNSGTFYYLAVIRKDGRHDIVVIQPSFKEPPEEVKSYRLTDEWLQKVFSGKIKSRKK